VVWLVNNDRACSTVALKAADISVAFAGTHALRGAGLEVRTGTVHALLGGNGSGKSTLIKVLAGVCRADPGGRVVMWDKSYPADGFTSDTARSAGLRFVHQDLGMFEDMTVAENFALYTKYPKAASGRIRWRSLRARVADLLEKFEIDARPESKVSTLRPALRTMLAVARALQDDDNHVDRVLVLDEPTASLPAAEVDLLLRSLRQRAEQGHAVIFVSHRLPEVLSLADDITVLRDGCAVATVAAATTSEREVAEAIAGRAVERFYPPMAPASSAAAVASVHELVAGPVRDFSVEILSGETVGLAGLLGAGRSSLLRAIFGDLKVTSGLIRVGSHVGPFPRPSDAMRAGIGYVPEDRANDAAFMDFSVGRNITVTVISSYFRRLRMRDRQEREDGEKRADEFLIQAPSVDSPLRSLSGGNQQKVILARWLQRRPRLLLLDEPTQGVDVVARAEIYQVIKAATGRGAGVIVASSDLDELAHICDRVLVLAAGRVVCEIGHDTLTPALLYEVAHSFGTGRAA
jgi:ribose transport system ATP-binding protein